MLDLSLAEKFVLCVLDSERKEGFFFYSGKYPACIVAAIFMELLLNETITMDSKKKIIINNKLDINKEYLKLIYDKIASEKTKNLKKWIEHYVVGFSSKPVKEVVKSVIEALVLNKTLQLGKEKGLLKEHVIYNIDKQNLESVIQNIRSEFLENSTLTKETIILSAIMLQCGLLKKYFSKDEEKKMKERIKEIKKSDEWANIKVVKQVLEELEMAIVAVAIVANS